MNTETHTPGPWFVDWDGKDVAVFAEANSGEPLLNLRSAKNLFDKDACLVAAAPQMYQALKACLGYFDEQWPGMDFGIPQQVRDVLNHAGHSLRPIHGKAGE